MQDKINDVCLFVGTPAFGGQVYANFVSTIMQLTSSGLRFSLYQISNEALVTRARNTIITEFYRHKVSTHLLFLDADVGISPNGIAKMLLAGKDVIGARVALKTFNPDGRMLFSTSKIKKREGDLGIVSRTATGVLMLSRNAVNALVEDADTYEIEGRGKFYDICKTGVVDNEYVSEDHWLCDTLTRKGFKIYVDTTIPTTHSGTHVWNSKTELDRRKRENIKE